jgi:hypothetical protein
LGTLNGHEDQVKALVVGEEWLLSGGDDGKVLEWALPDPMATAAQIDRQLGSWMEYPNNWIWDMQVCRNPRPSTTQG